MRDEINWYERLKNIDNNEITDKNHKLRPGVN